MFDILTFFDIFVRALDRGRKPLADIVPDVHRLREDPRTFLTNHPVNIGSAPRWGRSVVLGMLLTFALPLLFIVVIGLLLLLGLFSVNLGGKIEGGPAIGLVVMGIVLGLNVWFANRLMNARITLSPDGVEVHDFFSTVFCPWPLFSQPGSVAPVRVGLGTPGDRVPETSHMFLPIDARFLSLIEKRRRGRVVRRGERAKNAFIRIANRDQAVLSDSFRVEIQQLGQLILDIGNVLGRAAAPPTGDETALPIAVQKRGWIQVPFTRLSFPWICCVCGEATASTAPYTAKDWVLRYGRFLAVPGGRAMAFRVPQCFDCQKKIERRLARARGIGCLSGTIAAISGCAIYHFTGHPLDISCAGVTLTLLGAFAGYWIGNGLGQDRMPPVDCRRLSTTNGTVELRFREHNFEAAFIAQFK